MANPIVWARCASPAEARACETLTARLEEDGDGVRFLRTFATGDDGDAPNPAARRDIRRFLAEYDPMIVLCLGGQVDAALLQETEAANVPMILAEARPDALREITSGWFRSRSKASLTHVLLAFAADSRQAQSLIRAGVPEDRVHANSPLEEDPPILPHDEATRQKLAERLRNRPVWLARDLPMAELEIVRRGQQQAARRAHRLLCTITPHNLSDGPTYADQLSRAGHTVGLASAGDVPEETQQFFIADLAGQDGLWLRLAPMTYSGGSLTTGDAPDPFEAAALGSVVLHGFKTAPHQARHVRLTRAGASHPVAEAEKLGAAVELLLSPQRTADMARAGWDVTSRGAEASSRIVSAIQARLDGSR